MRSSHRSMWSLRVCLLSILTIPAALVGQVRTWHDYDVKFVCGLRPAQASRADWNAVSPGRYFSAINVFNPGDETAIIRPVVAATDARPVGGVTRAGGRLLLLPHQALELDCEEIFRLFPRIPFLKGFVALRSSGPLEVVAVYTAMNSQGTSSIDVEPIGGRTVPLPDCPDLTVAPTRPPSVDPLRRRTTVFVTVSNIGTADASSVEVTAEDNSDTTAPRIQSATVPLVAAGESVDLTLVIPFVVQTPAIPLIMLMVDPKNAIAECREDNNRRPVGR